jgi:parallel beta-helix repeat protein
VSATTWYVDDDGGAGINFTKIQDAVGAAQDNDTIIVYDGIYNENLTLNKQLTLKGSGMPVVDAGVSGSVIIVCANGCIIDGFKISRSGYGLKDAGIKVESDKNVIKSNIISNNWYGIHLRKRVSNNTIQDNKVVSNKYIGLSLDSHASNNIVLNNTINSNEDDGIEVDNSDNNIISNNTISLNNGKGVYVKDGSDNNMVCNNTILRNKGDGIGVGWYSSNNKIINNEIVFNADAGIGFGHTSCNLITNNTISFNDDDGIVLKTSHNNTIRSNTITSNDEMGIKLESAPNNSVYHNNLVDNDPNGYDDTGANNSWDNGPIIGGNYWDDHTCDGNPSNGRQPYHIDKGVYVDKTERLVTSDTYIDHNQLYNFDIEWYVGVWDVKNLDDVTITVTTPMDITHICKPWVWALYKNGSETSSDRFASSIDFYLPDKTVHAKPWADMVVNAMDEKGFTRIDISVTPVIPLDWCDLHIRADKIINVTAYPAQFHIELLILNHIKFSSGDINQNQEYTFSVIVDNPESVSLWLDKISGWGTEYSNRLTLPVNELGSVTLAQDVPVKWGYCVPQPSYTQSIQLCFKR